MIFNKLTIPVFSAEMVALKIIMGLKLPSHDFKKARRDEIDAYVI